MIRHGVIQANIKGILQIPNRYLDILIGRTNEPLAPLGIK